MSAIHALAALALLLAAGDTHAHASLVSTMPQDGAVLATSPEEIVLRFDEPVSALIVRLLDDAGTTVALPAAPRTEGRILRATLPSNLRQGTYLLSYRVTSADSHPVGGSIAFSIGRASWRVETDDTAFGPGPWRIAVRALRDAALLIAAGCALFVLAVASFPGARGALLMAGIAAAVFSLSGVGLQGAALIGHGEFLAPESWRIALRTTYGLSAMVAAVASLTIALGGTLARGGLRAILLATGALAVAASLPLTGHAAAVGPAVLARIAVGVHVLAAAFWAGSLVALYVLVTHGTGTAARSLRRFSRLAMVAVAALVAAGAGFAAMQLGSPVDLVDTRYGNLILAKLGLVAALVALAARNRFVLLPALERSTAGALPVLRRAIAAEMALAALVVVLTAILVQTPPGSASIQKQLASGTRAATLSITPGRSGHNEISVVFRDGQSLPFDPAAATLEISNTGAGVEPISRSLQRTAPGTYRHRGGELAFPGSWRVEIAVRFDDFESERLSTAVEIR